MPQPLIGILIVIPSWDIQFVPPLIDHNELVVIINLVVIQSVGCDLELDSRERPDRCGVCKGDGSSCRKQTQMKIPKARAVFVNVTDRPKKIKLFGNTTKLANNTKVFSNVTKERATNMTLNNIGTLQPKSILLMNKTVNGTGMVDNFISIFDSCVYMLTHEEGCSSIETVHNFQNMYAEQLNARA